jgi:hypothetical protein
VIRPDGQARQARWKQRCCPFPRYCTRQSLGSHLRKLVLHRRRRQDHAKRTMAGVSTYAGGAHRHRCCQTHTVVPRRSGDTTAAITQQGLDTGGCCRRCRSRFQSLTLKHDQPHATISKARAYELYFAPNVELTDEAGMWRTYRSNYRCGQKWKRRDPKLRARQVIDVYFRSLTYIYISCSALYFCCVQSVRKRAQMHS